MTTEEKADILIKELRWGILQMYPKASESEIFDISLSVINKVKGHLVNKR
jgi:hypothetical protein